MAKLESATDICLIGQRFPGVCDDLAAEYTHNGERYCVLHYPCEGKGAAFQSVLESRLQDSEFIDFRGMWLPQEYSQYFKNRTLGVQVNFSNSTFAGIADFYGTEFSASASFEKSEFCGEAIFSSKFTAGANFEYAVFRSSAQFRGALFTCDAARFEQASFCKEASFKDVVFDSKVGFRKTTFCKDILFDDTQFKGGADFREATFEGQVVFQATAQDKMFHVMKRLDLRDIQLQEQATAAFKTVTLRPSWFVGVSPREFSFTDVKWFRLNDWWKIRRVRNELEEVESIKVPEAAVLLRDACRELATNAENDHRYTEASRFRFWTLDAQRMQGWRGTWGLSLAFWYWLLSGYGEQQTRALLWLGVILLGFAGLYMLSDFPMEEPVTRSNLLPSIWQATVYSLSVMTRQRLPVEPDLGWTQFLVTLEGILGPLQIALFALSIRRKFMT